MRVHESEQRIDAAPSLQRGVEIFSTFVRDPADHPREQVGLGAEVMGGESATVPGGLTDGRERGRFVAALPHQLDRRLEHPPLRERSSLCLCEPVRVGCFGSQDILPSLGRGLCRFLANDKRKAEAAQTLPDYFSEKNACQ